ncbi:hypothetical protein M409DRAFT_17650 [Zasmidium cellare ATCC 36951]|uniref:Uncharacterized protein n=1 Tax=Zasmidium cellare ATCC 36951 TaxID=1080233 RepID=A0A6A6CYX9_ZASCE|nr:uncharacterized protein M409DRAFT_17650 [Zasmidium cellare ATCC 36951]KAF2172417.1 hypothetical protein M409DRAFT_17650 [Zasmidium cellare ATCC 36951]
MPKIGSDGVGKTERFKERRPNNAPVLAVTKFRNTSATYWKWLWMQWPEQHAQDLVLSVGEIPRPMAECREPLTNTTTPSPDSDRPRNVVESQHSDLDCQAFRSENGIKTPHGSERVVAGSRKEKCHPEETAACPLLKIVSLHTTD